MSQFKAFAQVQIFALFRRGDLRVGIIGNLLGGVTCNGRIDFNLPGGRIGRCIFTTDNAAFIVNFFLFIDRCRLISRRCILVRGRRFDLRSSRICSGKGEQEPQGEFFHLWLVLIPRSLFLQWLSNRRRGAPMHRARPFAHHTAAVRAEMHSQQRCGYWCHPVQAQQH